METLEVPRKSRQKDPWQATWRVRDMTPCMLLQAKSKWPSVSAVRMRGKKSSERPEKPWARNNWRKISSRQWVSWVLTYRRRVWSLVLCVERALCIILPVANACCWKGGGERGFDRWQILFFFPQRKRKLMKAEARTSAAAVGRGWWSYTTFLQWRLFCQKLSCPVLPLWHKRMCVMNLPTPGLFFKCSHKSLLVLKGWKIWLSYEFNFKMKTFWPSFSNTHIHTHAHTWRLELSSCSPDLCMQPVTHRDTTAVFLTLPGPQEWCFTSILQSLAAQSYLK